MYVNAHIFQPDKIDKSVKVRIHRNEGQLVYGRCVEMVSSAPNIISMHTLGCQKLRPFSHIPVPMIFPPFNLMPTVGKTELQIKTT